MKLTPFANFTNITVYEQLFHTKVFCTAFLLLQFSFVIFWQKNISTKGACKMLAKLTPGGNFTNFFCLAKSWRHTVFGKKISVQFHQ